jgi:ABC-type dipeptide/oligopeptide/nickel transport system permease subunit
VCRLHFRKNYRMKGQSSAESLRAIAWKRLRKNSGAVIGMWIIIVLVTIAVLAPILAPMDPNTQVLEYPSKPSLFRGNVLLKKNPVRTDEPFVMAIESFSVSGDTVRFIDPMKRSFALHTSAMFGNGVSEWHREPLYILGTDKYGRDILSRIMYGARIAFLVAIISETISIAIGILLGALAGYFRGRVDDVIMWFTNVMWSFPTVLLVIAFSVILGNGVWQTFVAIGLSGWVDLTRVVRGQFFSLREAEFIEATRAFGFGTFRTIFRHLLPNTLGPITVIATAGFATAITLEASLSFIGLGVQPPTASWGKMIQDGIGFLFVGQSLELVMYPCIVLGLTVYAFNLFGDGLRDAIDPKTMQR